MGGVGGWGGWVGSYSDYKANLSSTVTELANWNSNNTILMGFDTFEIKLVTQKFFLVPHHFREDPLPYPTGNSLVPTSHFGCLNVSASCKQVPPGLLVMSTF